MSTAVILAGGESRRMRRDKMELRFGGATLLELAVIKFLRHFDKVYVSVADPAKYPNVGAPKIVDVYPGCGPISGLHSALQNTDDEGVFLAAADLPLADPLAAVRIIELAGGSDVCLTVDSQMRYEPLFAYYRKSILPLVEQAIKSGSYSIAAIFGEVNVRVVTPDELGHLWRDNMLLNVNYPEDYRRLMRETSSGGKSGEKRGGVWSRQG